MQTEKEMVGKSWQTDVYLLEESLFDVAWSWLLTDMYKYIHFSENINSLNAEDTRWMIDNQYQRNSLRQ